MADTPKKELRRIQAEFRKLAESQVTLAQAGLILSDTMAAQIALLPEDDGDEPPPPPPPPPGEVTPEFDLVIGPMLGLGHVLDGRHSIAGLLTALAGAVVLLLAVNLLRIRELR